MIVFWLHLGRALTLIAGFVVPLTVGLCVVGLTFWFATWWPPLFAIEGKAFFLAVFFTSWGLLPYFWVVEFARMLRHIDRFFSAVQYYLNGQLTKQGDSVL